MVASLYTLISSVAEVVRLAFVFARPQSETRPFLGRVRVAQFWCLFKERGKERAEHRSFARIFA
jgi:hypothetical protein